MSQIRAAVQSPDLTDAALTSNQKLPGYRQLRSRSLRRCQPTAVEGAVLSRFFTSSAIGLIGKLGEFNSAIYLQIYCTGPWSTE
jgi:hypothetical protein